jgi:hypothetical protein
MGACASGPLAQRHLARPTDAGDELAGLEVSAQGPHRPGHENGPPTCFPMGAKEPSASKTQSKQPFERRCCNSARSAVFEQVALAVDLEALLAVRHWAISSSRLGRGISAMKRHADTTRLQLPIVLKNEASVCTAA